MLWRSIYVQLEDLYTVKELSRKCEKNLIFSVNELSRNMNDDNYCSNCA